MALLLAVAVIVVSATGCWDRTELNDEILVMAMGLDAAPEGQIAVTFVAPIARLLGGGGGGGGGEGGGGNPVHVETVVARDIAQAFQRYSTLTKRRVRFIHLGIVIIGQEMAWRGIATEIDFLSRYRELRLTTLMAVAERTAAEIASVQSIFESNPADLIEGVVRGAESKGLGVTTTLRQVLYEIGVPSVEVVLPILRIVSHQVGQDGGGGATGSPDQGSSSSHTHLRYDGAAVFKGDKMVGSLTREQNSLVAILQGRHGLGIITMPDPEVPGEDISFELTQETRRLNTGFSDGSPFVNLLIKPEGNIVEVTSDRDYMTREGMRTLEEAASRHLQEQMKAIISQTQSEWNADIIGFGRSFKKYFLTEQEWLKYSWNNVYRDVDISLDVQFHIRRVGLSWKPTNRPEAAP